MIYQAVNQLYAYILCSAHTQKHNLCA